MFVHVIMWKLNEIPFGKEKENVLVEMKNLLEGLNGKIPGVISLEAGINNFEDLNAFDIVLISKFDSKDAYLQYGKHPEHAKIVPFFKELNLSRSIVDYEV